ncbi:MAG: DUF1611 domain-containing protein [Gloeomargaritaceae cyanobacterium C42_A2020_066]|nr:DUF1611 domain-containing protein [Gloeomargaritaceae cyanobacterium C42_A2020_066]
MLTPERRVALLMHGGLTGLHGKTGLTLLRYSSAQIVAVIDREAAGRPVPVLTGIARDVPVVTDLSTALAYDPDTLVIGVAPSGGRLPERDWSDLAAAACHGLNLVNGLHTPLADHPELKAHLRPGQWIWDVRREPDNLTIASGQAAQTAGRRVLVVGTDMAVGKMSTALELQRAAQAAGYRAKFLATGQAGVMIAGTGIALDAIRVDFAAGAVEQLVVAHAHDQDLVIVEGQGSLFHPGSTATLPLLRGTQPTDLILVHRAGQTHIRNCPQVQLPPLQDAVQFYEAMACAAGAFAPATVVAIGLNTSHLEESEAWQAIADVANETGLPCTDPVRFGATQLLEALKLTGSKIA